MAQGRTQVSQDEDQRQSQRETRIADVAKARGVAGGAPAEAVFRLDDVHVHYGEFLALRGVDLEIGRNEITAFIGPSGCGKSTLIRCLNRMNDLIPGARVEGKIDYHGQDLYGDGVDPVEVRRRIGMVFQKPNPFPKSIYDNVAFGPQGRSACSPRAWTTWSSGPCAERRPVGRGQGQAQAERAWRSPAASSSGSASPGRSPSRPT